MRERISFETWVGWLAGSAVVLCAGVFALMAYAFDNFETKEHAREKAQSIENRLDRIELKLDAALERLPRK